MLTPDQRRLLDALVDQSALAIERVQLVEDMSIAPSATSNRIGFVRALLTSISHDLKTPLASVLGCCQSTLRDLSARNWARPKSADLLSPP